MVEKIKWLFEKLHFSSARTNEGMDWGQAVVVTTDPIQSVAPQVLSSSSSSQEGKLLCDNNENGFELDWTDGWTRCYGIVVAYPQLEQWCSPLYIVSYLFVCPDYSVVERICPRQMDTRLAKDIKLFVLDQPSWRNGDQWRRNTRRCSDDDQKRIRRGLSPSLAYGQKCYYYCLSRSTDTQFGCG